MNALKRFWAFMKNNPARIFVAALLLVVFFGPLFAYLAGKIVAKSELLKSFWTSQSDALKGTAAASSGSGSTTTPPATK